MVKLLHGRCVQLYDLDEPSIARKCVYVSKASSLVMHLDLFGANRTEPFKRSRRKHGYL